MKDRDRIEKLQAEYLLNLIDIPKKLIYYAHVQTLKAAKLYLDAAYSGALHDGGAGEKIACLTAFIEGYNLALNDCSNWKNHKRKGTSEMRPYVKGEDLTEISVNKEDNPGTDMGMIARNPENHNDQWYVAREWFEANYEVD